MFGLFSKKAAVKVPEDYGTLGTDLHSHLLPGIDDGSPDLATSLELIQALQQLGFSKLITTPHVMSDFYPNTRDVILRKRDEVQEAITEMGIPVQFDAAAEYYIDESFAALFQREPLLTLPGNRVLVEMSFHQPYPNLHQVLFDLQMKGYHPILAHPERYPYYNKVEQFEELRQIGCVLQVNLLSLIGYYGKPIQHNARKIIENGLAAYIATDLHHERHAGKLKEALTHELVGKALQGALQNNAL